MSADPVLEAVTPDVVTDDPVVVELHRMLVRLEDLALGGEGSAAPAARIDRIAALERLRAAVAACQAAESVRFADERVEEQEAAGVDPEVIGRGIEDEIGLACGTSSYVAARRLAIARGWCTDLPRTFAQLSRGVISEQVGELVARETRHLDPVTRRGVDDRLAAADLPQVNTKAAAGVIRRHAFEADPAAYAARAASERELRRVTLRSAPDTMAVLTGYLPAEQGVACLTALRQRTAALTANGDRRGRDQIMADTLVELLTGQRTATDVPVEVQVMLPVGALFDTGDLQGSASGSAPSEPASALIAGYGPLPASTVRRFLSDTRGQLWLRRLFTTDDGARRDLVGGDHRRRRFDGWLRTMIDLRDQVCRHPYCGAPIRHRDHVVAHRDDGSTTLANGQGLCEHHNYVRELPGWSVELVEPGGTGRPHEVRTSTPTGHHYTSRAPAPP